MISREDIQGYAEVKSGEMFTDEDILSYIRLREYSMLTLDTMGRIIGISQTMGMVGVFFWGIPDTDIQVLKDEYTKKVVNEIIRVYIESDFDVSVHKNMEDEVNLNTYIGDYLDFCRICQRKFGQRANKGSRREIIEYEVTNLYRIATEEASRLEVNIFKVDRNLKYVKNLLGDFIQPSK